MRSDPFALIVFGHKQVLRHLVSRYIPDALMNQPKSGFTFPRHNLLEKSEMPRLTGIDEPFINQAWSRRLDGGGWSSLSVRVLTAEAFMNRHSLNQTGDQ